MATNIKSIVPFIFAAALAPGATNHQIFVGVITDSMCGKDHAAMKVAPDSKCVLECVKGGGKYAVSVGNESYLLSDQETPGQFAGQKVKVTGTLYEKTKILKADSIAAQGR